MRRGCWLIVVALGLVSVSATVTTGGPPKEREYQIDVKMLEGDPLGSGEDGTVHALSQPSMFTVEKQESRVQAGQTLKLDGEEVFSGTEMKITPQRGKEGTIRLSMVFKYTEIVSEKEDSLLLQTNEARYLRTVKPGEVLRLHLSKASEHQQWVELTVKEFEPGK
jgi:hypothetical protein